MPFLRGSLLLLAFGLVYVAAFSLTSSGLTPEHALVGLLALFGAALLPCLAHTLDVWRQVHSRDQESNPVLLSLRRDLDLLFRTHEDHAERIHLALSRLETELAPPPPPAPAGNPIPAIVALEETVREHIAECSANGSSVRQSLVRLDTSVQKLNQRVEQLEFRFPDALPAASPPAKSATIAPVSPSENSSLKSEVSSPLLNRALAGNSAPSGHVSRLIAGGFRTAPENSPVADPAAAPDSLG